MSRPIPAPDLAALKGATKDLVKAVGGLDRAAELTGLSTSQIARWYASRDERDPERPSWTVADLVSVVLLERELDELGDPRRPVTACLARLAGCDLDLGRDRRERIRVAAAAEGITGAAHDMVGELLRVLSDGRVTPAEAESADRRAAALETELVRLRGALAAARAGEGAR